MPAMPWTWVTPVDPAAEYLMVATRFRLVHRHDLPGVISATGALWSGFAQTEGLVGYSLSSRVTRGTLATLSAWRDLDTMLAFVRGPAHRQVTLRTRDRLRESTITSWTTQGAVLPTDWATAERQLDSAAEPPD